MYSTKKKAGCFCFSEGKDDGQSTIRSYRYRQDRIVVYNHLSDNPRMAFSFSAKIVKNYILAEDFVGSEKI